MRSTAKEILIFLVLVFLFSSVPYALVVHTHHLEAGGGLVVRLLMWCPAFAAFATCALRKIPLRSLGWGWFPARYEWLAYVLPLLYATPVYMATWLAVRGSFSFAPLREAMERSFALPHWPHLAVFGLALPMLATVGVVASIASALGEEIGWRGFLLPRLVGRFGFTVGCFFSGCIWAVWHYPPLLLADYNAGTNPKYALTCFTLMVIAMAFVMGWLRLKSGSLWPCAMLHASHNLFIQAIFDRLTAPVGRALYITTEFGAGLVLTIGAVAFLLWKKRAELPPALPLAATPFDTSALAS